MLRVNATRNVALVANQLVDRDSLTAERLPGNAVSALKCTVHLDPAVAILLDGAEPKPTTTIGFGDRQPQDALSQGRRTVGKGLAARDPIQRAASADVFGCAMHASGGK
jgi:hypothetical protein